MSNIPEPFERYLKLLGIKNHPAGLKGLEELVLNHLCKVPFENVSKLLLLDREGKGRIHGYIVNEPPRTLEFFRQTILDSFKAGQTFMSCLRITRFFKDHTVELRDRTLGYYGGVKSSERELKNMAEVEHAVKNDLQMPRCPVRKAVEVLERVTGKPFF